MIPFQEKKILIVGDLLLDQYFVGQVNRISPEAPVPVIKLSENKFALGGAGNVAHNITSLGGKAGLISLIGNDEHGATCKDLLNKYNISNHLIESHYKTIVKLRVIGGQQQIVRLDIEDTISLNQHLETTIIDTFKLVIEDYDLHKDKTNKK